MKYVVFGSGGFAKEVIGYIVSDGHSIEAVVSENPFNDPQFKHFNLVNTIAVGEYPGAAFVLAVGDIETKKRIVSQNEDRWETFAHSSSFVSKFAKLGKGCVICPNTCVLGDAQVGNFVTVNVFCTIAHDNVIGDYVTYSPYVGTMGVCKIGNECFFGTASYCVPKVSLPAGTKVSAGAIVRKSIQTPETLYGDPATPKQKKD